MSMQPWLVTTLGAEVDLLTGYPFPSARYTTDPRSYKLLRGDNVGQGQVRWADAKRWPSGVDAGLEAYQLRPGDVVLAMDRPWIEAGLKYAAITRGDVPALLVQRVARLRARLGLDQTFLKYVIASREFSEHVLAVQTGTAVPHISGSQIREFRFHKPPLGQQRAIVALLGALDDKIDLNRRTNETLDSMARAIFKSWFVDFDPVRAKAEGRQPAGMNADTAALFPSEWEILSDTQIPLGWKVQPLNTAISVHDSRRVPLSSRERALRCGIFPYYGAAAVMGYVDEYLFDGIYVLIGEDGSVVKQDDTPVIQYAWGKFWVNNHAHVLSGKGHICTEHLMLFLKQVNIRPYITGAVQPKLTQENLNRIPFLFPGDNIASVFQTSIAPAFSMLRLKCNESRTLAALRDALLPRLLSGEIRLCEAEKIVEAHV